MVCVLDMSCAESSGMDGDGMSTMSVVVVVFCIDNAVRVTLDWVVTSHVLGIMGWLKGVASIYGNSVLNIDVSSENRRPIV